MLLKYLHKTSPKGLLGNQREGFYLVTAHKTVLRYSDEIYHFENTKSKGSGRRGSIQNTVQMKVPVINLYSAHQL